MKVRVKIIVSGLVQGVGYRYFTREKAVLYNITGYTKNLNNGSVEIEAEGEKNLIHEFIEDLKVGPFHAKVNAVYVEEMVYENSYDKFSIY